MIKDTLNERLINKEKIRSNVLNHSKMYSKNKNDIFNFRMIEIATFACIIVFVTIVGISNFNNNFFNIKISANQKDDFNVANDSIINNNEYHEANLSDQKIYSIPKINDYYESTSYQVDIAYNFIIYKNRIYNMIQNVNNDIANNLKLDKIGITDKDANDYYNSKSILDVKSIYSAFSIGTEVYSLKGYDPNIRLMVYNNGSAMIFESLKNVKIDNFTELVNLLNLNKNVKSVNSIVNIVNGPTVSNKDVTKNEISNEKYSELINILNNTYLVDIDEIRANYNKNGKNENKRIEISLQDGTNVYLTIYSNGYVNYSSLYFKIANDSFEKLYNQL